MAMGSTHFIKNLLHCTILRHFILPFQFFLVSAHCILLGCRVTHIHSSLVPPCPIALIVATNTLSYLLHSQTVVCLLRCNLSLRHFKILTWPTCCKAMSLSEVFGGDISGSWYFSPASVSVGVNVSLDDTGRDHSDQSDSETSSRST